MRIGRVEQTAEQDRHHNVKQSGYQDAVEGSRVDEKQMGAGERTHSACSDECIDTER